MKPLVCGIDPGLSGAIAFLGAAGLTICDMPTHDIKGKRHLDLYELARLVDLHAADIRLAVVEDVHAMPKQGVSSSFKFGKTAGIAEMAMAAHFIPMRVVTPQKWKAVFGLTSDKDASRRMASRLMPQFCHFWTRVKDDGRAEAALMALYGTRLQ